MIWKLYFNFANYIFRYLVGPDYGYLQYYQDTQIWKYKIFSDLFLLFFTVSALVAIIFFLVFNGKKMPAIYGTRKHWWIFLVIGVIINMTAVFVYLRLNQIASGNNHMYCTMTANAVFGVVAYFFISLIINRWSTSAKKIPVKLF